MRIYELQPNDAKSFYGKAKVWDTGERTLLYSYNMLVCEIDNATGEFIRMWGGYSKTTMRHINAFIKLFNIDGGGKAWWDSLPVVR